jgi:MFS superfamily sulfate permease-like transporter
VWVGAIAAAAPFTVARLALCDNAAAAAADGQWSEAVTGSILAGVVGVIFGRMEIGRVTAAAAGTAKEEKIEGTGA